MRTESASNLTVASRFTPSNISKARERFRGNTPFFLSKENAVEYGVKEVTAMKRKVIGLAICAALWMGVLAPLSGAAQVRVNLNVGGPPPVIVQGPPERATKPVAVMHVVPEDIAQATALQVACGLQELAE